MFSREVSAVCELRPCQEVLPERGSNHPAFVEMLFLWGQPSERDPRYRHVVLPSGFVVVETADPCRFEVRDLGGFVRALAFTPSARPRIPTIAPVRRFALSTENIDSKHRGVVLDRGAAVYRTSAFPSPETAVAKAKKWLDENKPRWESYVAAVNFESGS
jgi:hypothetical protein